MVASKASGRGIFQAGVAGGGIGTMVARLISLMPDKKSTAKPALTLLTPCITIGVSGMYLFVKDLLFEKILQDMVFHGAY
jgi:hypothetical protein